MKIYFTKEYWKVFGMAAVSLTILIFIVLGYEAVKNRNGEYSKYENEYSGITLRVSKEKGGFPIPKEFPNEMIELYPNLRLRDIYIIKNKNDEIIELRIEAFSDDEIAMIKTYYEDEKNYNTDYETTFIVDEANSEFMPKSSLVEEKTRITIIMKKN